MSASPMPTPTLIQLGKDPVRILLCTELATIRLTLKAVLEKSGYLVETSSTIEDAIEHVENGRFALVLCESTGHAPAECKRLLATAKSQSYHPATAVVRVNPEADSDSELTEEMLIETVDIPELLTQVAELIGQRRARRAARVAG